MNYTTATDSDINSRLAELLAEQEIVDNGELGEFTPKQWLEMHDWLAADYCNDWSAIGPLVEQYGITMYKHKTGKWDVSKPLVNAICIDVNPKKAAAICIIRVLEGSYEALSRSYFYFEHHSFDYCNDRKSRYV